MGCVSSKESQEDTPRGKGSTNSRPQSAGKKRGSSTQASKPSTADGKSGKAGSQPAAASVTATQSAAGGIAAANKAPNGSSGPGAGSEPAGDSKLGEPHRPLPAVLQPGVQPPGPMVLEVPSQQPSLWLRFSYLTQRGYYPEAPGKANQDSFFVIPQFGGYANMHLFGVFDGHGDQGTPCSQFARDRLAYNLINHPALLTDTGRAFFDAFVLANDEMHRCPIDDSMSGSTGIVVLLNGRKLYCANVGDSRAVLAEWQPADKDEHRGNEGKPPGGNHDGEIEKATSEAGITMGGKKLTAFDLSHDQTPFRGDECERVKAAGARVLTLDQLEGVKDPNIQCWGQEGDDDGDPPRLWVQNGMYPGTAFTRSLGDSVAERIGVFAEPEVKEVDLDERHPFFVVASDGVFEFMSSQDVVDVVSSKPEGLG